MLSVPPLGSNSRIRAAKPWDLTPTEQRMLEGYPSPEDVLTNSKQVKLADLTIADLFTGKLDAVETGMVKDAMNLSGNLKSLVCGIEHTIEGSMKNCRDSFHEVSYVSFKRSGLQLTIEYHIASTRYPRVPSTLSFEMERRDSELHSMLRETSHGESFLSLSLLEHQTEDQARLTTSLLTAFPISSFQDL